MYSLKTEAPFDELSPDLIVECVEEAYGIKLESFIFPYPSYINRVYGLRSEDLHEFVVKFYRPGRWKREAILEEHGFLFQLADFDCPVLCPLVDESGDSLQTLVLGPEQEAETEYNFALFPKKGGRIFDAEKEEDWLRLGTLAGRIHTVGRMEKAKNRKTLSGLLFKEYTQELLQSGFIHPDFLHAFDSVCTQAYEKLKPLLDSAAMQRIHGDFHRGNILDRASEGLLLIDFDDMLSGPAVQDIWLLLPGHYRECRRELALILEGYREFSEFNSEELRLIEPLRFFRMIHFLHWQAKQSGDKGFYNAFPDWGCRTFWLKEIEDLQDQLSEL